jgi:hypothetical protein
MTEKIYSKIDDSKLLHLIVRCSEISDGRYDIVSPENFIQCSTLRLPKDKTFKPHKHFWKFREREVIAQESWIVIRGSVKCFFYDLDDSLICEKIIYPGDASFTLEGGHNYLILEDDTLVYEYKTGLYEGQEFDKKFI